MGLVPKQNETKFQILISCQEIIILIIFIAVVIYMRSQSIRTCSLGLEGICCGWPLYNLLVSAVPWMQTVAAETVWFPYKAVVTVPWAQPALTKRNMDYDVQRRGVQAAAAVKRKVDCRKKTELHTQFHIQYGKNPKILETCIETSIKVLQK